MLSPADAELAEREREIPGLATLLDPEALLRALRSAGMMLEPASAVITYLRYQPGSSVVAALEISGREGVQTAYARASRRGHGAVPIGPASKRALDGEDAGERSIVLEDLAIRFCIFPHDARLRALARLAAARSRKRLISRVLPGRPDLHEVEIEPVGYKPERRFVGRLRSEVSCDVAFKFYRRRNYEAAKNNAAVLRPGQALGLPRWLGQSDRLRITALEWIPGPLLRDTFSGRRPDLSGVPRAAAALAELHAQKASLPSRTPAESINALRASAGLLGALLPRRAPETEALLDHIARRLSQLPDVEVTLHGDFYAKQILLGGERATLIDLDTAARGHPLADIGLFLAHLERDRALGRIPGETAFSVRDSFLESYQQARRRPLPEGVGAYTAASLARLAAYPFRNRHPGWPAAIEDLLCRAEELASA